MPHPLAAIQTMSRSKALVFAGGILSACLLISFLLNIPAMSAARLQAILENAGFPRVTIGDIAYDWNGIRTDNIALDAYGFDKIERLDIRLSWPAFLFGNKVQEATISGLSLSRDVDDLKETLQGPMQRLLEVTDARIAIENATLDLSTTVGALRFVLQATIDPPGEDNLQKISANLSTKQYQLGFDSKWSGTLTRDGQLDLNADVVDGRLHFGPMAITRYNGWISVKAGQQGVSLQSQIDAGGADLFGVPLQDVTLVSDASLNATTMMFRSGMAGLPTVALTADMNLSAESHDLDITLKGENLSRFLNRIAAERKNGMNVPKTLDTATPFNINATYQPDRRFAGGPLPFALEGTRGDSKMLLGNFLIYADTRDLRGSVEIDPAVAKGIQEFLGIGSDQMDRNFVRLDGKLDGLFKTTPDPAPASPPSP